jgi:ribosomal protein L1
MLYERQNGKIIVPKGVMPAPLATPPDGVDTASPEALESFQQVQQRIKEFRDAEQSS